jgi:hypothetical protein
MTSCTELKMNERRVLAQMLQAKPDSPKLQRLLVANRSMILWSRK